MIYKRLFIDYTRKKYLENFVSEKNKIVKI